MSITLGARSNGNRREPWIIFVELLQLRICDVRLYVYMEICPVWLSGLMFLSTGSPAGRLLVLLIRHSLLKKSLVLPSSGTLWNRWMGFWKTVQSLFKQKHESYSCGMMAKMLWTHWGNLSRLRPWEWIQAPHVCDGRRRDIVANEELWQEPSSQEWQWRWTVTQKSGRVSHLFDFLRLMFSFGFGLKKKKAPVILVCLGK